MTCTYRHSFLESDEFYAYSLHFLSIFQIPLHIFGTYIVLFKTPIHMERVKLSMLVLHLTFAWLDVYLTILSIPVILFPIVSGYPLGLLYYLGVPIRLMVYFGFTSLYLVTPGIILFFENRYNYLVRTDSTSQSRKIKRVIQHFINYLLAFLAFLPAALEDPDIARAREYARQKLPCFPPQIIDSSRFFILGTDTTLFLLGVIPFLIIGWTQIATFFIRTSRYIYKTKAQSERTSSMQKQFFKSLCIQIAIPVVIILIPGGYVIYTSVSGNFDLALTHISIIWISTHGLFATVVMIVVHKPYRQATLEVLRLSKPQGLHHIRVVPVSASYNID
ncbi:Serpentine Receptor, class H [Caenorhabditis elegans]|uniref:Serpentine Receptor, class H n=1 Tax=Caenorhabditis elegans TaxID=6239 RepID=O45403_CAEEL|nr:Serpentine Receptor, class H [Caenorhabditis elegans]CAB04175.1 Serpentine Receptor, class H [Caenorhabditis elegans]|eukprot:NP_507147.1 Serpentine Receptor, class H [Caenorhabditis elegans]